MALSLRTAGVCVFLRNGYGLWPVYKKQSFCKLPPVSPPSGSEQEAQEDKESVKGDARAERSALPPSGTGGEPHSSQQAVEDKQEIPVVQDSDPSNKRDAAKKKLHDLLSSLASADMMPSEQNVKLSRPKPRQKRRTTTAAATATATITKEVAQQEPTIEPELLTATKQVAESLGGDVAATESQLLSTLKQHSLEATVSEASAPSLSELFAGMRVERGESWSSRRQPESKQFDGKPSSGQQTPGERPSSRRLRSRGSTTPMPGTVTRVNLFGAEPLGVFMTDAKKVEEEQPILARWEEAEKQGIQEATAHPPSNAFEEMVQWTEQGKLWTFPIDNEIGLLQEQNIGFHEHVFLERHLTGWCPRRGPIRHFMELVCTGLSKNPYLTVERKIAHIEWYKNYFAQKEGLLKEMGAIEN